MNCAEDRRIRWTTYQNLDLWFDSWETFCVEYGFATINKDGSLHFTEKMKARMLNMDETCLSTDGSNGNRGGRPDCDVLRRTLPTARESDIEVITYNNDDNREFIGG